MIKLVSEKSSHQARERLCLNPRTTLALISGEKSLLILVAEPRSQYPVGGISLRRTGEGGLVQGEGRHEEKVKILLLHMANKPTATVVARKPSARIHRARGVVGIMSLCLLFVLSLSFPGTGPRSKRKRGKKKWVRTS